MKANFVLFYIDNEIIITTPEFEKETLKEYFFKGSGRNIDNYDREEKFEKAVNILSKNVLL
jgi:hypothetical protein